MTTYLMKENTLKWNKTKPNKMSQEIIQKKNILKYLENIIKV